MSSPLTDVVDGYTALGSYLLDRWSAQASKVASRLADGTYDADSAAADFAAAASLAAETGFLLASEALDAAAILSGRQGGPFIVESESFYTSLPGATLTLAGPLTNGFGSDTLPAGVVRVQPLQVGPAGTEFNLTAIATGHRSGTYVGAVDASTPAAAESLTVWIIVP